MTIGGAFGYSEDLAKAKGSVEGSYKKKKYLPLDLRPEKTQAIRRRLPKQGFFSLSFSLSLVEIRCNSCKDLL